MLASMHQPRPCGPLQVALGSVEGLAALLKRGNQADLLLCNIPGAGDSKPSLPQFRGRALPGWCSDLLSGLLVSQAWPGLQAGPWAAARLEAQRLVGDQGAGAC